MIVIQQFVIFISKFVPWRCYDAELPTTVYRVVMVGYAALKDAALSDESSIFINVKALNKLDLTTWIDLEYDLKNKKMILN